MLILTLVLVSIAGVIWYITRPRIKDSEYPIGSCDLSVEISETTPLSSSPIITQNIEDKHFHDKLFAALRIPESQIEHEKNSTSESILTSDDSLTLTPLTKEVHVNVFRSVPPIQEVPVGDGDQISKPTIKKPRYYHKNK